MREANFDGLVGPTHNYAGLSFGNVASTRNLGSESSPRAAALEGLRKMRFVAGLGVTQGILPPMLRPSIAALRGLGFSGARDADVIASAAKHDRTLLALCSSASAMWTANAATVAPSSDTSDHRVHFSVANLFDRPHRSIEHPQTQRTLEAVFADRERFVVHPALQMGQAFSDEGAANHTRFVSREDPTISLHLFVYGREGLSGERPTRFPARQTLMASQAVARRHGITQRSVFLPQSVRAIDAGVFHNDVISVGHDDLFFVHERAFESLDLLRDIEARVPGLRSAIVFEGEVPLDDAVRSYLFNSQLLWAEGRRVILVPSECREVESVSRCLDRLLEEGIVSAVHALDLRQSMRNGGGPACLRLRVPLTDAEIAAVNPGCLWSEALHEQLERWVNAHYRERLAPEDLGDPQLLEESRTALDRLTQLLGLGSIYDFQR